MRCARLLLDGPLPAGDAAIQFAWQQVQELVERGLLDGYRDPTSWLRSTTETAVVGKPAEADDTPRPQSPPPLASSAEHSR
jgi:hypothetical protein